MECARSMILAQGLELEFWGKAVKSLVVKPLHMSLMRRGPN
jgi:hypothetical protein